MKERMPYSHRQCMTTVACLEREGSSSSHHHSQHHHLLHLHNHPRPTNKCCTGATTSLVSPNKTFEDSFVSTSSSMNNTMKEQSLELHRQPSLVASPQQYESRSKTAGEHTVRESDGSDQVDFAQSQLERLDLSSTAREVTNTAVTVETIKTTCQDSLQSIATVPHQVPPPTNSVLNDGSAQYASQLQNDMAESASREEFLIFIKILFKVLDQAQEIHTRNRAKKLVAECTRKNRQGDPLYMPLMDAVQKRLRLFVGEAHWRKSMLLLRHYCQQRQRRQAVV